MKLPTDDIENLFKFRNWT